MQGIVPVVYFALLARVGRIGSDTTPAQGALIGVRFLLLTDASRARSWCRRRDYPTEG
jgi:hypothetical protein